MAKEKRAAAIDADIFKKLTDSDPDGALFMQIMDDLNIAPVMHSYVYEYELNGNTTAKKLVKNSVIKILKDSQFLNTQIQSTYENHFKSAFYYFNSIEFDSIKFNGDITKYHHDKQSLGEIRTSIMAFYLGIDLFMSDDGGAKMFVENKLKSRRHRIEVYNLKDTLIKVFENENRTTKWKDIKGMAKKAFEKTMYKYDEVNQIWHSGGQ